MDGLPHQLLQVNQSELDDRMLDFIDGAEEGTLLDVVPERVRDDGANVFDFAFFLGFIVDEGVVEKVLTLEVGADDDFVDQEDLFGNGAVGGLDDTPCSGSFPFMKMRSSSFWLSSGALSRTESGNTVSFA